MGIYDELSQLDNATNSPQAQTPKSPSRPKAQLVYPPAHQTREPINQSTGQSTALSTSRPVDRANDTTTYPPASSVSGVGGEPAAVGQRPKSFYLTQNQSDALDDVVKRVAQHQQVRHRLDARRVSRPDRSTIMRLILDEVDLSDDSLIDRLVSRLVD